MVVNRESSTGWDGGVGQVSGEGRVSEVHYRAVKVVGADELGWMGLGRRGRTVVAMGFQLVFL